VCVYLSKTRRSKPSRRRGADEGRFLGCASLSFSRELRFERVPNIISIKSDQQDN